MFRTNTCSMSANPISAPSVVVCGRSSSMPAAISAQPVTI
jgi:hypothetical protein